MQGLISLTESEVTGRTTLPRQKSAGVAWLLSLFVPGAGHVYAGLYLRGALVFGFSLLGLLALASSGAAGSRGIEAVAGTALLVLPLLWVFGFLDSYMTVVEGNRGIDPTLVDNPRVAALLNLLTRGFGYFYLGERTKGIAIFVVLSLVQFLPSALTGRVAAATSIAIFGVGIWISFDAYRLGRRAFQSQVASMELPPAPPPSRLPVLVPLLLASVTALGLLLVFGTGLVVLLLRGQPTA